MFVTHYDEVYLTQTPVRKLGDQLHVTGDCQNVEIVEEDVHHQNNSQVQQGLGGDVPHLPVFAGQLGVVRLWKTKWTSFTLHQSPVVNLFIVKQQ